MFINVAIEASIVLINVDYRSQYSTYTFSIVDTDKLTGTFIKVISDLG